MAVRIIGVQLASPSDCLSLCHNQALWEPQADPSAVIWLVCYDSPHGFLSLLAWPTLILKHLPKSALLLFSPPPHPWTITALNKQKAEKKAGEKGTTDRGREWWREGGLWGGRSEVHVLRRCVLSSFRHCKMNNSVSLCPLCEGLAFSRCE